MKPADRTAEDRVIAFMRACKFEGPCCVLASLTIRDALRQLGVAADVRSVALRVRARGGSPALTLHEVGVGLDDVWGQPYRGEDWPGHLVVTTRRTLIDPTFYAARRKAWDWTPDVAVVPRTMRSPPDVMQFGRVAMPILAVMQEQLPDLEDYRFEATWLGFSRNRGWEKSPDTRPERRREAVAEIVAQCREYVARAA